MSLRAESDPRQSSGSLEQLPKSAETTTIPTSLRLPSAPVVAAEHTPTGASTTSHKVHPVGEPLSPASYAEAVAHDTILGELSVGSCTTLNCGRGCWFAYSSRGCREGAACDRCHHSACAIPADEQRRRNRKEKSRQRPSKKKRSKALAQKMAAMEPEDHEGGIGCTEKKYLQESLLEIPQKYEERQKVDDGPDRGTLSAARTAVASTTSTAGGDYSKHFVSSEESCRASSRPTVLSSSSIGSVSSPASTDSTATGGSSTAYSSPVRCASANPSTMGLSPLHAAMLTDHTSGGYAYNPKKQQPTAQMPSPKLRGTPFGMSYVEAASSAMGGRCDAASFAAPDLYKNATTASTSDQLPCMFEGWAGLIDALERTFGLVSSPVGRREVSSSFPPN